jgi:hypothetical protein
MSSSLRDSNFPPGFIRRYLNASAKALGATKKCLHPHAPSGCGGPAIKAHSIQRSGPLSVIVDEQMKVLAWNALEGWGIVKPIEAAQPSTLGWREASIFSGFCAKHDDDTFSLIEKQHFTGTPHQCAIMGYRSLCFELYRKIDSLVIRPQQRTIRSQLVHQSIENQISEIETITDAGLESGISYLVDLKKRYESAISNTCFDDFSYCLFRFNGTLSVASTGSINPDWDIQGKRIQDLGSLNEAMQGLTYGIAVDEKGFSVVFSWPHDFSLIAHFIDQISRLDGSSLATALIIFMFAYSENTYFSSSWWNGLRTAQRARLRDLALNPIQYGSPVNYKGSSLVDWRLETVTRSANRAETSRPID